MRESSLSIAASLIAAVMLLRVAAPARARADDSSAPPPAASDGTSGASSSTDDDISVPAAPDWDRVEEVEGGSSGDQVLELPQTIDANRAKAGNGGSGAQDGSQDDAEAPDQVGSIDDYENQPAATAAVGAYVGPIPMRLGTNAIGMAPVAIVPGTHVMPGAGAMTPLAPIIVTPGGFGPFPATSPMLAAPRGSGAMPGGWWTRTH